MLCFHEIYHVLDDSNAVIMQSDSNNVHLI